MNKYVPVIGMEIHVELKTKSKMFCSCKNGLGVETEPNVNICPVCTAQPGTLPVVNAEAIKFVQMAGLALNCQIAEISKFDRKNYFYPDIPKGYQISQYDQPLCGLGHIDIIINDQEAITKKIGITRIHMEEDTGKLVHPKGADHSLIDFNRAGVPLMELVTEPDIETGKEARLFCQKLQQIFRYLKISEADMEKGHMRCEVNISLMDTNEPRIFQMKKDLGRDITISDIRAKFGDIREFFGTKAEIKNLNSFRVVERAVDYEIIRQSEILEKGEKVVQETMGWDEARGITVSQRKKESAHDYRYFPEPDIPPMRFATEYVENLRRHLPELPDAKAKRFVEGYGLSRENVEVIVSDKSLAEYFEQVVSEINEKMQCQEVIADKEKCTKLAANYMVSELQKHLVKNSQTIADVKISAENYAELIGFVADGKINSSAAQAVLEEMYATGGDPSQIIEARGLLQVSDEGVLETVMDEVLTKNQKSVEDFKAGKQNALQFLMGQVMKESKGKANPAMVVEMLKIKLG
ncbi:MAG: Aspartyl/glutamyl-tRNA(Asn/Gln) amidotransferase subunit B [Candidatus Moranbacteria bacterium GW2011_GWA2_39_41]|nr:MAG: Aspartyl/glutamyl-tRNA(Asn/Gln) amidotransferase subunit B [Candidatus Moranbacteria bacterium GW2011_GWA2_39_41]